MPRPTKAFIEERKALFSQGKRRCRSCQRILPLSAFRAKKNALDGLDNACQTCQDADYKRRWREDTAYRTKHQAQTRARYSEYWGREKRQRKFYLKRLYGLTIEQYEGMVESQRGKCALCGRVPSARKYTSRSSEVVLHVDHDHRTGKDGIPIRLRELLCNTCNVGLGSFQDDEKLLFLAIAYLRKHS